MISNNDFSTSSSAGEQAQELKDQGNDFFHKGNIPDAIRCYSAALHCIHERNDGNDNDIILLSTTLLSNRAMCHLKAAETVSSTKSKSDDSTVQRNHEQSLRNCIDDCTTALQTLDNIGNVKNSSNTSRNTASESEKGKRKAKNNLLQTRGKILYRRAKALVAMGKLSNSIIPDSSGAVGGYIHLNGMDNEEKNLNAAAKDLLQLLSFDPNNSEAVTLLRSIRSQYGAGGQEGGVEGESSSGLGRSPISRSLDYLRSLLVGFEDGNGGNDSSKCDTDIGQMKQDKYEETGVINSALICLRTIQASLADDLSSSAMDIGRRGGVPLLIQTARREVLAKVLSSSSHQRQEEATDIMDQCRIASLHILSACCSHHPFAIKYIREGDENSLSSGAMAQIILGEEARASAIPSGGGNGLPNVILAAIAVFVRLIVHWNHLEIKLAFAPEILEDGTLVEVATSSLDEEDMEVDAISVCQAAIAAFSWGRSSADFSEIGPPRAALDLLSTWTASDDLDTIDAISDEHSFTASAHTHKGARQRFRTSADEIRSMKPRQAAAHRKREADYRRKNLRRANRRISIFCGDGISGGLDAMLTCAAVTDDPRLRRELGLQVGRWMNVVAEANDGNDEEVKKLIYRGLGCTDWKIGKSEGDNEKKDEVSSFTALTIEELEDDGEEKEIEEMDEINNAHLLAMMKRGQLTASLLLGIPAVGTWALKYGWSDGDGVSELKRLISSNDSRAMSIASELVSSASSVEGARPLLATLVEEGTLEDLLTHSDADVRSGAASCAAKIGLASKALSSNEGEVSGLLDVAIELLFDEERCDWGNETKTQLLPKQSPLSTKEYTTSMERGVEVLAYLVSKTSVKERVTSGYIPPGTPANRKPSLDRLVEIAYSPNTADAHIAFGLAGIFNLLAVSIDTLRKEAFIGKEITKEQYDQLQSMGKTEEEKEAEAKKEDKDRDDPASVSERIRKLASANVPGAMVKLLERSSSDATQEKLLEGMGRMASEPSVRGIMIQQGCLTSCLRLSKGDEPSEKEKMLLRRARSCVAKLLVTTNPAILTVSQRSGAIGPLLKLVKDSDALDLQHFEALMSITNLAGFDIETKNGVVAQGGIPILAYAMFSDHEMVRQAATEALCNMVPHPKFMEYLTKEDNMRIWIAFSLDYEANFACARAAIGCLAMAIPDPEVTKAIILSPNFNELIRTLLECGQLELMHRVLALIAGLLEHGGDCRTAVLTTGAGPFCEAYLTSYSDENRTMDDFKFSSVDRGSLTATLNLAKEIARLTR